MTYCSPMSNVVSNNVTRKSSRSDVVPTVSVTSPAEPNKHERHESNFLRDSQIMGEESYALESKAHPTTNNMHAIRRFRPTFTESMCDLHPISPQRLFELLTKDSASVQIIDIRPFTMYSFTHIQSAISICIPSTLLRRQTFGFSKIMDFVAPQDVERLRDLSRTKNIVFYDQCTSHCEADSSIRRTAAKFLNANPELHNRLFWIVGGLVAVARDFPEMIETGDDLITTANVLESNDVESELMNLPRVKKNSDLSMSVSQESMELNSTGNSQVTTDFTEVTPKLTLSSVRASPRSPFSLIPVMTGKDYPLGSPQVTPSKVQPPLDDSSKISVEENIASKLYEFPYWLVGAVRRTEQGQNVLAEVFQRLQTAEFYRIYSGPYREHDSKFLSPDTKLVSPLSPSTPLSGTKLAGDPGMSSPASCSGSSKKEYSRSQRQKQQQQQQRSQLSIKTVIESSPKLSKQQNQYIIVAGDDPKKNRYTNIAPFGYNRVLVRGGNYLNASYVSSSISAFQYIATQAPVPASFGDFWWCCWEQKVPVIVMLTTLFTESGQVKGTKYWFDSEYDGLKIRLVSESSQNIGNTKGGVTIRKIRLILNDSKHDLIHLQYENWPDLGCPTDIKEVLELIELKDRFLLEFDKTESARVLVHCSAGCGRTGTFCTIDSVIDYLSRLTWDQAQNDIVDRVQEVVHEFRKQRIAMVQNQKQLLLCYQSVILWYMRQLDNCTTQPPVKTELVRNTKLSQDG